MRRSALLVLPLALLLTGAKGTKGKKSEAPEESPPAQVESGSGAGRSDIQQQILDSMSVTTTIELLDAGAEPRSPLVYAPVPGAVTVIETRNAQEMSMNLMGQDMSMPMPAMVQTTRATVGDRGADGVVPVRIEQMGMKMDGGDPAMVAAMQQGMEGLSGLVFDMRVGPDGRVAGMEMVGGSGDNALFVQQMMKKMEQSLTPFPGEAVGVGGSWKATMAMDIAGMNMVVEQTYKLTERDASHAHVSVVSALRNDSSQMALPGLPPGANVEFRKFLGTGGGDLDIALGAVASTGAITMDIEMEMAVSGVGGPEEPMVMAMKVKQLTSMTKVAAK